MPDHGDVSQKRLKRMGLRLFEKDIKCLWRIIGDYQAVASGLTARERDINCLASF